LKTISYVNLVGIGSGFEMTKGAGFNVGYSKQMFLEVLLFQLNQDLLLNLMQHLEKTLYIVHPYPYVIGLI